MFSFPGSPPETPTKITATGAVFADFGTNSPRITGSINEASLQVCRGEILNQNTTETCLGISDLDEETQSTISAPTTPEFTQNVRSNRFNTQMVLSPLVTPSQIYKRRYRAEGETPLFDEDVDIPELSEVRKCGVSTPPHFPNTAPPQLPPTPPLTPKSGFKSPIHREENVITSTKAVPLEEGFDAAPPSPSPTSHSHIPLLLASLTSHKSSCSSCKSFSIDINLFTTISTAFSSSISTTTIPFENNIHPAQISHIIALVPTPSTNTISETQTRFFALPNYTTTFNYVEISFHALQNYHSFHKSGFQISCSSTCGKHSNGFQIWKFSNVEVVYVGGGRRERICARGVAGWRKKVLERKLGYYSR